MREVALTLECHSKADFHSYVGTAKRDKILAHGGGMGHIDLVPIEWMFSTAHPSFAWSASRPMSGRKSDEFNRR
jgi:hypothetical protein